MTAPAVRRAPLGRGRRLLPPLATALALGTATLAVALRDPHVPGSWGFCPWLVLTGTYCPGCGGLRAVNDLVHLRVTDAMSSNALVVLLVVAGVVAWLTWTLGIVRGRPAGQRIRSRLARPWTGYCLVLVLLAFTVLRNLPAGAWLAP